jgi:hypothetical protein
MTFSSLCYASRSINIDRFARARRYRSASGVPICQSDVLLDFHESIASMQAFNLLYQNSNNIQFNSLMAIAATQLLILSNSHSRFNHTFLAVP